MKVTLRHTPRFDDIFADESYEKLAREFAVERQVRIFLSRVIQLYLDDRTGTWNEITTYALLWPIRHPGTPSDAVARVRNASELIQDLYGRHDPARLRGALLEGLVRTRLEDRYAGEFLEDNAYLSIRNGVAYDSSTDIDVVGWDETDGVGECHDCKARARWLDPLWIKELDENLPTAEFKIGVVTTDSQLTVQARLQQNGVNPSRRTRLIGLERLWDFAPLQKPTRPAS
jgi:hypothetical protein